MPDERGEWTEWFPYSKHRSPGGWSRERTIAATSDGRDSRYFADVDVEAIERVAAQSGAPVPSPKPATTYKVCEFAEIVGASEGLPSRWLRVESTNGVFHGHPISRRVYSAWRRRIGAKP